jgi:predicted TIM-barrel fold metal-dependent hydrolase
MIYGSDWPVSVLGGGVERWRTIADELTESWNDADQRAFFTGNASRVYGLGTTTEAAHD